MMNAAHTTPAEQTSQHTPAPWLVADSWHTWPQARGKHERHILVLARDTSEPSICHVATVEPDKIEVQARELANARRIVACVNACEGIATEALEQDAVQKLLKAAVHALHQFDRSQALDIAGFVVENLRAAIEQIEEGQQ